MTATKAKLKKKYPARRDTPGLAAPTVESAPPQLRLIANDPGSSGIRLYGEEGYIKLPAQIAMNGRGVMTGVEGLGTRVRPLKIESSFFQPLWIGDDASYFGEPVQNLNHERQTGTPEMRALLYASLSRYQKKYGRFTTPLRMGVALPNQFLMGERAIVERRKAQVRDWIEGAHEWIADGEKFSVQCQEVVITSQGAAALFNYLLNDDGAYIAERKAAFKGDVGVISIGMDTIELLGMEDLKQSPRFTTGAKLGTRRLLTILSPSHSGYTLMELEPRLRNGGFDSETLSQANKTWQSEVTGFIDEVWSTNWRRFKVVVIVGGGAILLRQSLPLYFEGKAFIPDDPILAVSRGLYKKMKQTAMLKKED